MKIKHIQVVPRAQQKRTEMAFSMLWQAFQATKTGTPVGQESSLQLKDFKSYYLKLLLLEVSHICNTAKEVRFQYCGILGKLSRNFKWKICQSPYILPENDSSIKKKKAYSFKG